MLLKIAFIFWVSCCFFSIQGDVDGFYLIKASNVFKMGCVTFFYWVCQKDAVGYGRVVTAALRTFWLSFLAIECYPWLPLSVLAIRTGSGLTAVHLTLYIYFGFWLIFSLILFVYYSMVKNLKPIA